MEAYGIRIHENGGPEKLQFEKIVIDEPNNNLVLIKNEIIGVNFIDTYHRSGLYKVKLPFTIGVEGTGVVENVGEKVENYKSGDRVAYVGVTGSYAEYILVPENKLVLIPDNIEFQEAGAGMLQGLTAQYLTDTTFPINANHRCLIHAAAGGVGLLLIQFAKQKGAYVIGTVSAPEKAELAMKAGADEIILYTEQDFEKEVLRITDNQKVNVVYDSVGKSTFDKSLNCLAPLGYMVLFGQSSGPVDTFDPRILNEKGSLFLTRPSLFHYISEENIYRKRANAVFELISNKKLQLKIENVFPLSQAAEVHMLLEDRQTTGKVLLSP